ncbi:sensory rhodopsin transducer [Nonomuraea insulae]|uniref:Sensory rhodopsin transducer n=1 Tax=Nonomuraea insulae TaxID=1616787 RepID=A0ABW1CEF9_9ACTN
MPTNETPPTQQIPGTRHTWWFPDGDLPEPVEGDRFVSHEALIVLNPAKQSSRLRLTFYWTDRPPTSFDHDIVVEGERVRCLRLDRLQDLGIDFTIPFRTQYAIRLDSSVPVFCQYGRLDSVQANLALMAAPSFG